MTFRANTVWIARHADRLDFADPSWFATAERPYDTPLSPQGHLQAERLAQRLRGEPIAHVLSSPFLRTMETAEPIARALDLPIKIDGGFSEWLSRDWFPAPPRILSPVERVTLFPRIDSDYRERGDARYGETSGEALRRAGETARRIAGELDGSLLIVGHGVSLLGAVGGLLGPKSLEAIEAAPPEVPYASLGKLERHGQVWQLRFAWDTAHLA